jgi:hypothetical protein
METVDPLILVLKFFQADANNREKPESVPYEALNNAMQSLGGAGSFGGAPYIDGERFAIRFEQDPVLQQFVDGYDKAGVRLKTNAPQQQEPTTASDTLQDKPFSDILSVAKKTAKRRLKK